MKYKTILCKHSDTPKGCVYKDKCQFAHGLHELRLGFSLGNNFNMNQNSSFSQQQKSDDQNLKKTPNPANFKIVKCKNFEKEGQCKYGNTCTFAHGETELRTKTENSMVPGGNNFNSTQPNPMMYQPYMMDPNLLFYMQNQMNYQMNPDPNQMGQFGNLGVDPNSVNLNTSPNSNGNMFDMSNPNFNMGMYSMYQPPQSNINN